MLIKLELYEHSDKWLRNCKGHVKGEICLLDKSNFSS